MKANANMRYSDGRMERMMNNNDSVQYKELDIFYPQFDTIGLCCTNIMIPCFHKDVTMALAGPLTRNYGLISSHDRIVGRCVSDGKVYLESEPIPLIGTFVFCEGKYAFYNRLTGEKLKELFDDTARKNGIAFQGYEWVVNGERTSLWFKNKEKKYHFRALCNLDGRLCVIECREKTECERFKDLLTELGVKNAINLDTGLGWQNSWRMDSGGRSRIMHFFPWPFGSNRLIFRKNRPCEPKAEAIAVIGVNPYNRQLLEKAREAEYRTIVFPCGREIFPNRRDKRSCELADKFYPVQATRTKKVVSICRKENVAGVVANVLDETALIVSRISSELGLHGIPYDNFLKIKDKRVVRDMLEGVDGLSRIWYYEYDGKRMPPTYPCVVKPCTSTGKIGVNIVSSEDEFRSAVLYAEKSGKGKILVEEYIPGTEFCVETISFESEHKVLQITDKESTNDRHRVEIAYHQPAVLPAEVIARIQRIVPEILRKIGYRDGAAHIDMRLTPEGKLCLVEINLRGGGDNISNFLVEYSTGYDYVRGIIDVAVGKFTFPTIVNSHYSGIYFLCKQTADRKEFFEKADGKPWLTRKVIWKKKLKDCTTSFNRQGFLMYKSDHKVLPDE